MIEYQIISKEIMNKTVIQSHQTDRKRTNYNFHQLEDKVQRMFNTGQPGSYVRPHRHLNPPKIECFLVLQGKAAVLIFDKNGNISSSHILEAGKNSFGIDIKPGIWHSLLFLEKDTVIFEIKNGPYIASSDKDFADWAPPEKTAESEIYLEQLLDRINESYKQ